MGLLSSLFGMIGFGLGLPIGLFIGFYLFVYSKSEDVEVINPFSNCCSLLCVRACVCVRVSTVALRFNAMGRFVEMLRDVCLFASRFLFSCIRSHTIRVCVCVF